VTDRQLWVEGVPVAFYVVEPELDIRLGPRPYLHPGRTLGGATVTDPLRPSVAPRRIAGDAGGRLLLHESRRVAASPAPLGWWLSCDYELTAPPGPDVVLGGPATSGYPGAGGMAGSSGVPGPVSRGVHRCRGHGSGAGERGTVAGADCRGAYTLVFEGLSGDDRWFVRTTGEYAGVCAALAYDRPLALAAGSTLSRPIRVLVADGELTRAQVSDASPAR